MEKIGIKIFDSFTKERFTGNPAGVVTEADILTDREMQRIASEINAPTTGFCKKRQANEFDVRFFTPKQEIEMCGHVVIAISKALMDEKRVLHGNSSKIAIRYFTKAGLVPVDVSYDTEGSPYFMMDLKTPSFKEPDVTISELAKLLGIPSDLIEQELPLEMALGALRHLFIAVKGVNGVRELKPDFTALAELSETLGLDSINVFTLETVNKKFDVHSRDFCSGIGHDEEAASGTTNGALSCYLIKNRLIPLEKKEPLVIMAEQGFEMGRPSIIRSEILVHDERIEKVQVGGTAVLSLEGNVFMG